MVIRDLIGPGGFDPVTRNSDPIVRWPMILTTETGFQLRQVFWWHCNRRYNCCAMGQIERVQGWWAWLTSVTLAMIGRPVAYKSARFPNWRRRRSFCVGD